MSAPDLAAVLLAVASVVAAVVLVVLAAALVVTLRDLRRALDEVREVALPAVEDLREGAARAQVDLDRVDELLDRADTIGRTADSASRLAYSAMATPVVKVMSMATGTSRAAQRLRRGPDGRRPRRGAAP